MTMCKCELAFGAPEQIHVGAIQDLLPLQDATIQRLLDLDGQQPQAPFPAYIIWRGAPLPDGSGNWRWASEPLLDTEVCPVCQREIAALYADGLGAR